MNESKQSFNDQVAQVVTKATGNMWFFWLSLLFIVSLRVAKPPTPSTLLLNIENDLQLLLLAANAVVSAKQTTSLTKILKHIGRDTDTIENLEKKQAS